MRKGAKFIVVFAVLCLVLAGAVACSSTKTPTATSPEVEAVRAYADPAAQTTLEGLSENDLAKYTQYADAQFKAAVTRDVLDKTATQINSQLGSFVSITFLRAEKQNEYTIVHYRARYSGREVGVRMVFNQEHLIAGQWFE